MKPFSSVRNRLMVVTAALMLSAAGNASPAPELAVADLLLPEATAWTAFSELPALPADRVAALHGELTRSFRASSMGRGLERADCAFLQAALPTVAAAVKAGLREVDVDADGLKDIVYSGPARCSEGDLTVIWYGTRTGLEVRADLAGRWRVMRMLPGKAPRLSAASLGCCSDPFDEYSFGSIDNPRNIRSIKVAKAMQLPKVTAAGSSRPFRSTKPVALRSAPRVDDRYAEGPSNMMEHAVFGNVLSKYLPGVEGQVLAEETDAAGRVWLFIRTERDSGRLRHDAPYPVDAGWVPGDATTPAK